jgi:hypothetical protein
MTPGFVNYWEHEITKPEGPQYSFAQKMVELPKVVFSRTLNSLDGRNVRVENGDLKATVNQLKRGLGRDIVVYSGATLVSSLIENALIDEFNCLSILWRSEMACEFSRIACHLGSEHRYVSGSRLKVLLAPCAAPATVHPAADRTALLAGAHRVAQFYSAIALDGVGYRLANSSTECPSFDIVP